MTRRPNLPVAGRFPFLAVISIVCVPAILGLQSGCGHRSPTPTRADSAATPESNPGPAPIAPRPEIDSPPELIVTSDPPAADGPDPDQVAFADVGRSEPVFRPDDVRPRYDDARAARLGILRYESTHLLLYTDIDPDVARSLPPLMDQAYAAFVEYFGPLPPARNGAEYQMTGFIMADQDRFREAGMLPQQASDLLVHGIHRGSEFWMNSQEYDYYQRHLMIHEGTHCFMTVLRGVRPSQWYMEGMAEYFGTHRIDADGQATFGVMPDDPAQFVGFGRVEMLREEVTAGNFLSVSQVLALDSNDYIASRREPYAWSWAFCKFLDAHPRYQPLFRELRNYQYDPRFAGVAEKLLAPLSRILDIEWGLFIRNLEYGYDIERAAIDFRRGAPISSGRSVPFDLRADAGWQSSGVWLDADATYTVAAAGEVTLDLLPKPWISEPQGVSIRYSAGRPLGRVVAAILSDGQSDPDDAGTLWQVIDVGRGCELVPSVSGTLYLRVNDDWSSLNHNAGAYQLRVSKP